MIRCSKAARDLDQWITENGYGRFEGYTGKGHLRYRLTNGPRSSGPPLHPTSVLSSTRSPSSVAVWPAPPPRAVEAPPPKESSMTSNNLSQIADVLERIESHLLTIALLLAARQESAVKIYVDGRSTLGEIRSGEAQEAGR